MRLKYISTIDYSIVTNEWLGPCERDPLDGKGI
jgi:hypothetical protein